MPFPKEILAALETIIDQVKLTPEAMKMIFSEDAYHALEHHKLADIQSEKGPKEIIYNFFGMKDYWKTGRNILGMIMVHSPEYPTYFIPAFTQTKETGDSGHIKKGEGVRGLITGALEGIAVGALVSGAKIKPREMVPYIVLGAALQYASSKLFPWLGEKAGLYLYNQKLNKTSALNQSVKTVDKPLTTVNAIKPVAPQFKGRNLYNNYSVKKLGI